MKDRRKKEGRTITLLVISFLFIAFIIGSTGMHHRIAEMLGNAADSAIDFVMFDSPEQAEKYKEKFGK